MAASTISIVAVTGPTLGRDDRGRTVPPMTDPDLSATARKLASVLEPVAGQVYFSPECHANYTALGFDPSPGDANGVALPDGVAYFTSRGR